MAILDRGGRLFGRINLIDLAAFLAIVLLIGLFVFGYRLYSSGYRELVRKEIKDEHKWAPAQSYITSVRTKKAVILYARIPSYVRGEVSVGDAEAWTQETEFPLRLLDLQPVEEKPGGFFLLLEGVVARAPNGVWYAGKNRPLRIGETLFFTARNYKLWGKIIRVLDDDIDSKSLSRLTRDIRIED